MARRHAMLSHTVTSGDLIDLDAGIGIEVQKYPGYDYVSLHDIACFAEDNTIKDLGSKYMKAFVSGSIIDPDPTGEVDVSYPCKHLLISHTEERLDDELIVEEGDVINFILMTERH